MKKYINGATKWPRCTKPVFSFSNPCDISLGISHKWIVLSFYIQYRVYIADPFRNDHNYLNCILVRVC